MKQLNYLPFMAKAIVSGVIAGLGAAIAAAPEGITLAEGLTIASATLVAGYAVWQTPNATLNLDDAEG